MALTTEEREHPDLISSERLMTWQEFIEWLRLMADRWEKAAIAEEELNVSDDLRELHPDCLWDWISSLV